MGPPPTFAAERSLWRQGLSLIAGIDEVGRGPLAGPVAAGAVILPPGARADARPSGRFHWLSGVRDSKQLSAAARADLAPLIWRDALAAAVAFVPVDSIDRLGIAEAARQAMLRAVGDLSCRPHHLLIDAFRLLACSLPQTPIAGGDALHHNKGYATREHLDALWRLGPCLLHRRSFAPVREMLVLSESSPEPS